MAFPGYTSIQKILKCRRRVIFSSIVILILLQFLYLHINQTTVRKYIRSRRDWLEGKTVTSPKQFASVPNKTVRSLRGVFQDTKFVGSVLNKSPPVLSAIRWDNITRENTSDQSVVMENAEDDVLDEHSLLINKTFDNRKQRAVTQRDVPNFLRYRMCPQCFGKKGKLRDFGREALEEKKHKYIVSKLNMTLARNDSCDGCFKNVFNYVISGDSVCSGNEDIDLVFLITTTHRNFKGRAVLRNTWLSIANTSSSVRYVFLLGETSNKNLSSLVKQENDKYRDIVKEDFFDSYYNLTYKTMSALRWVTKRCARAKYVMKTDDDMFINVPNLLKLLQLPYIQAKLNNSVMGNCWKGKPVRNKRSKYYTSYESYPRYHLPAICAGTGYIMRMGIAEKIYAVTPNVPFFRLEDVYVGLCLEKLDIQTFGQSGFSVAANIKSCYLRWKRIYSIHAGNYTNIQRIWDSCRSPYVYKRVHGRKGYILHKHTH